MNQNQKPRSITARLDQLSPRTRGIVREVRAPDDDLRRLMAMGVCEGRWVEVVQPGNPLIIEVLGARIGVSARLAARVFIESAAESVAPSADPSLSGQVAFA